MILVYHSIDIDQFIYSLALVARLIYPIFVRKLTTTHSYGGSTYQLYSVR